MTNGNKPLLDKIRALLSKTVERGATEHEAEAAMVAASRLLESHNLSLLDVEGGEDEIKSDVGHDWVTMGTTQVTGYTWCMKLARGVANLCHCDFLYNHHVLTITFVGSKAEVATAKELYTWLASQIKTLCRVARKSYEFEPGSGEYKKFTKDFFDGCAMRVESRCYEEKRKRETSTPGQALVRLTSERNKNYVAATWPTSKARARNDKPKYQTEAVRIGYRAGNLVNMNSSKEIHAGALKQLAGIA